MWILVITLLYHVYIYIIQVHALKYACLAKEITIRARIDNKKPTGKSTKKAKKPSQSSSSRSNATPSRRSRRNNSNNPSSGNRNKIGGKIKFGTIGRNHNNNASKRVYGAIQEMDEQFAAELNAREGNGMFSDDNEGPSNEELLDEIYGLKQGLVAKEQQLQDLEIKLRDELCSNAQTHLQEMETTYVYLSLSLSLSLYVCPCVSGYMYVCMCVYTGINSN